MLIAAKSLRQPQIVLPVFHVKQS